MFAKLFIPHRLMMVRDFSDAHKFVVILLRVFSFYLLFRCDLLLFVPSFDLLTFFFF